MLGIITTLLTLQGIGLGTYAAGAGVKSWWGLINNDDKEFVRVPMKKHLYKNWLIQVEDASLHKPTGKYFTYVECRLIKKREYIEAQSVEELQGKVEKIVTEMSVMVDEYNRKARA